MLSDQQIRQAVLGVYRIAGRVRLPLPAVICLTMQQLGTGYDDYLEHFHAIHKFIRSNWGNDGLFSRRRGIQGGIKVRAHVKLGKGCLL